MEWVDVATIVGALTAVFGIVIGLQTFWFAHALDAMRSEMHRGFDRLEARLDRLEGGSRPASGASD